MRIEGEGRERARIAYAFEKDEQLTFEVSPVANIPANYSEVTR